MGLDKYYRQLAQGADATIANAKAEQILLSVREQLTGQLEQFQNLTVEQTTALRLQKEGITDLTRAEAQQALGLARQVDQQNAYKEQIEQARQSTEQFSNTLRGLFGELFERGPKAFFDKMLSTLKQTLTRMLSDLLTSQALKILGIVPGGSQGGGSRTGGFGGQQSSGGIGGFLRGIFGGGGAGGGGNFL